MHLVLELERVENVATAVRIEEAETWVRSADGHIAQNIDSLKSNTTNLSNRIESKPISLFLRVCASSARFRAEAVQDDGYADKKLQHLC